MGANARRLALRMATRYDSGFGTVDYTCDKCGHKVKSRALPQGWSDEGGNRHRCPDHKDWPYEFTCETCPATVGYDDGTFESRVMDQGWMPENETTGGALCSACAAKWLDADGSLKPGAPVKPAVTAARRIAGHGPDRRGTPPGGQPPQPYAIGPARYAKKMMAIRCAPDGTGFKTRAARLAEVLARGRYSNREGAYLLSRAAATRFEKLYAEGWDGATLGDALIPPTSDSAGRIAGTESDGALREREIHELDQQWGQPPTYDIGLELELGRNMWGKLKPRIRSRIEAVVSNPSQRTWSDAFSIIVGSDGWMTLWQAVIAVDPSFPTRGPGFDDDGEQGPWDEIPDQRTLLKALQYATH